MHMRSLMNYYYVHLTVHVCVSAAMMETKKLLILASIRQPMADHGNKVQFHLFTNLTFFFHL